ncbi:helix-turn-helix domain-containing protein [Sediminitomix flava]|uniref:AraC-like DNA-binding protein n=1 Tax=Sediminitomix flava TaxID=379075 RepID=A0A315ZEN6_SEDFL|nr:AraC family transcriptional regulator [Sediminitomix flava]PWJ43184.1 AraC-like DNA-binding protein [Sediminitomix flava]
MTLYQLLLLVGAFQALIMTFFLFVSKKNKTPNRILSIMTFSWSICCLTFSLQSDEFWYSYPHLFKIGSIFIPAFFPPLYLYIKHITNNEKGFKKSDLLHFLPSLVYILASIPFYIQTAEIKRLVILENQPEFLATYNDSIDIIYNISAVLQCIIYSFASLRLLKQFNRSIKSLVSDVELITFKWLKILIWVNIIIWLFGSTGVIFLLFDSQEQASLIYHLVYLSIVVVIYFMSYYALKQPEVFRSLHHLEKPIAEEIQAIEEHIEMSLGEVNEDLKDSSKPIVDEKLQKEIEDVKTYLEKEKPYLNVQLTLPELANEVGFHRNHMSFVLNYSFGKKFYDVINDYRIEEAKHLLLDESYQDYKIGYIAEKSGFKSKATFYRIFKQKTGITPSEFKEICKEEQCSNSKK